MPEQAVANASRHRWFGRSKAMSRDPDSPDFVPTPQDYVELLARIDRNLDQIERNLAACIVPRG